MSVRFIKARKPFRALLRHALGAATVLTLLANPLSAQTTTDTAPAATPPAATNPVETPVEAAQPPTAAPAAEGENTNSNSAPTAAPAVDQGQAQSTQTDPSATAPVTALEQPAPASERADIPHNLSPVGMFMAADWVVKSVMVGLALASLVTWTVWLAKSLELMGARSRAKRVIRAIRDSKTLADAIAMNANRRGPAARMLHEAARELKLSEEALDHADNAGVKERVSSVLGRIEAYAGRRMMRGTGALATIGSVGPFVGLFGTVWGVMNAFIGISESQTTNLAVVAPGIAEALLATAIGLVAAIPAVVIYNIFARSITGYRQLLADAAAGVERLVSRDLDFRKVPPGARSKSTVSLVAGE